MITEELIISEIERLEKESAELRQKHEVLVRENQAAQQRFQQAVLNNQNRFQQITGAVTHFRQLLNGSEPNQPSKEKPTQ